MAGFEAAIDLLRTAWRERWRVGVFGDYDVDGVTTTTILTTYLEAIGIEVVARVATREGGYGFSRVEAEAPARGRRAHGPDRRLRHLGPRRARLAQGPRHPDDRHRSPSGPGDRCRPPRRS
jgi:hypothetical protein